ncbi:unnamed protein product [Brassica oleracea]
MELNTKNFHIGVRAIFKPCGERLVVVIKILGSNWSDINYNNNDLSAYRLVIQPSHLPETFRKQDSIGTAHKRPQDVSNNEGTVMYGDMHSVVIISWERLDAQGFFQVGEWMRKGDEGGEYGTVEIVVGGLVGSVTVGMHGAFRDFGRGGGFEVE